MNKEKSPSKLCGSLTRPLPKGQLTALGWGIWHLPVPFPPNAAHYIKGAASNLGLMEVYEVAKKIEKQTRNDRLEGIAESAQALKEKLNEIAGLARG